MDTDDHARASELLTLAAATETLAAMGNHSQLLELIVQIAARVIRASAAPMLLLIVRGQIDVLTPGPSGNEVRVAVLREGDYFGEMALIEDIPRTATVRAASPTTTLVIDRAQFLALLDSLPRLRSAFAAIIQTRRAAERALLAPGA